MKLPTWDECVEARAYSRSSALHEFIYLYEPAGEADAQEFRHNLEVLIAEIEDKTAEELIK